MPQLHCQLLAHSNSRHLQQLYTGFFLLHQSGRIKLSQHICKEPGTGTLLERSVRAARHAHLRVIVNNSLRLHYDTHDSWEIDVEYLNETDFYFKRSYAPQQLQQLGEQRHKIHPLGLNYAVYPNSFDRFGVHRSLTVSSGEKTYTPFLRALNLFPHLVFAPRVQHMSALETVCKFHSGRRPAASTLPGVALHRRITADTAASGAWVRALSLGLWPQSEFPNNLLPQPSSQPKILFMVRAWEPDDNPDLRTDWADKISQLNESRAACISALKKEYGRRFYGGFMPTPFATQHYKSLLMPDHKLASKKHYLRVLQAYPIGVATTGLHDSIGWKFAEYVAFAKAIISEPLNAELPGDLEQNRNYLIFRSPEELLEQAATLFSGHEIRRTMMANNARYYQAYMRPDCLILNTLLSAIAQAAKSTLIS